jgi:hypothetical protein
LISETRAIVDAIQRFLDRLRQGWMVGVAAKACGFNPGSMRNHVNRSPERRDAYERAKAESERRFQDKFLEGVAKYGTTTGACGYAGIAPHVIAYRIKKNPLLWKAILTAKAKHEMELVDQIRDTGNPQALMRLLEKVHRNTYPD